MRHASGETYTHYAPPRAVKGNRGVPPTIPSQRGSRRDSINENDPNLDKNYGQYWETTSFQASTARSRILPCHTALGIAWAPFVPQSLAHESM